MFPFDHVFHTYTWPGPFGWLFRNTPGNLAASAIAFFAGWMLKGRQVVHGLHAKMDAHKDHHAARFDALEAKVDAQFDKMAKEQGHQLAQILEASHGVDDEGSEKFGSASVAPQVDNSGTRPPPPPPPPPPAQPSGTPPVPPSPYPYGFPGF